MPPKFVRLWPRVRVTEIATSSLVTSLLLAFIAFSSVYAGARRIEKGTTTNSGTRLWVSATLPQGKVGTAYVGALGVRGGVAPYTFSETGSLPAGIALNSSTGALSGTPTASGLFYFTAFVKDSAGNVGDRKLSISIAPTAQVSVQVSPTSATIASGATQQFSAAVSGSTNTSVTWSTSAGSISSTGLLTAPKVSAISYVTVTASSVASIDSKASATVTVNPPASTNITVSLNPTSATLTAGSTQQFAATVTGTSNTSVVWVTSAGSISSTGLLTAPSVSVPTSVTITAKSAALLDAKAYAAVTVNPSTTTPATVSVSVTPASTVVQTSGTVQFNASVSGSTNTAVTWKSGLGSISSSGLYTAPVSGGTDTVIATSQADPTKAASATVTIQSSSGPNTGGGNGGTPNPSANAYCSPSGTCSGPATDGPANMPVNCMYTPVSATPSPGTVRGPDSTTTAVQTDINAAACGDTILVAAGSSLGPITLPAKKCDNAHWITIKSTGVSSASFPAEGVRMTPCWSGIASMPNRPAYPCPSPQVLTFKIVTPGSTNGVIVPGGDHYRIIGAEITRVTTGGVSVSNLVDLSASGTQTNNIIFDRVWFHGVNQDGHFPMTSQSTDTSTTRAVWLGQSNHIAVIDSYLSDFYNTGSMSSNGQTDAQCIGGGAGNIPNSGWGVYKFVNNHCEAAAEGLILGGSGGPPLTPSGCTIMVNCNQDTPTDIEVRQNYFFKPLSWNGNTTTVNTVGWPVVKNGFEMKTGARALFEGNVIENCWYSAQVCSSFSVAPVNQQSGGSNPVATCPTCTIRDFTLRYNYSYNTAYGIALYAFMPMGCSTCQSQGGDRISIHDNIIGDNMNLGNLASTSTGDGMEIMAVVDSTGRGLNQLNNIEISHNTFVRSIRSLAIFGGGPAGQMNNWSMQNNIWAFGTYGFLDIGNPGGCDTPYGATNNAYGILQACVTNWTVDHNAVFNWNSTTLGSKWPTNGSGSGNFFFTGSSGVGFTNYGTGNSNLNPGNYALSTSSSLHNAASDGTDIGANVSTLLSVISGVRQ